MVQLVVGQQYRNRVKDVLTIIAPIKEDDPFYRLGHRFIDAVGRPYRADGIATSDGMTSRFDLVEACSQATEEKTSSVNTSSEEADAVMEEFFMSDAYDPDAVTRKMTVKAAIQFTLDKMKKASNVRV